MATGKRRSGKKPTGKASTRTAARPKTKRASIKKVVPRRRRQTDGQRVGAAFRSSHDFHLQLFDELPSPIWAAGLDAKCNYFNKNWLTFTGRTWEQELGDGWSEGVHPEDRGRCVTSYLEAFEARVPFELEYRLRRHDGEYRWIVDVGGPFYDHSGSFAGYIGSCFDITERKRLEQQLLQSKKMEAIGRLAGGVAHDFNNLLTAIMGYSELLLSEVDSEESCRRNTEQIKKAAERAATLTRQLLAFSRCQVLKMKVLNLNAVVVAMEPMLRRLIGEEITLVTVLDRALAHTKADVSQIEQVIMNLVVNAADAMPHGGVLTIETANVQLDQAYADQHGLIPPGAYVKLIVSDAGHGMDAETQAHIFEPFFTTKEQGRGTGLGLATVYGVIKQSGGYIWVYSEPGQGTTFKIYLPRVEDAIETTEQFVMPTESLHGGEVILLVEDDEAVRAVRCYTCRATPMTL